MNKSLLTLKKLANIGKIISKIVYICCIVGTIGCAIGLVTLIIGSTALSIGGVTIHGLVDYTGPSNLAIPNVAAAMVTCVGEVLIAKIAVDYFADMYVQTSPFTEENGQKTIQFGIKALVFPLVTTIVSAIVYGILAVLAGGSMFGKGDYGYSITIGIFFIILGIVFKAGASNDNNKENTAV